MTPMLETGLLSGRQERCIAVVDIPLVRAGTGDTPVLTIGGGQTRLWDSASNEESSSLARED
jgi:hypothetical protein